MSRSTLVFFFSLLLASLPTGASAAPPGPDAAAIEFFEKKIRPLLAAQCQSCHSAKKQRGNLRLDSRAGLLQGGDTGPAIVSGAPEKSLLVKAISYREHLRMPPRSKLPDEQIADLTKWVSMGAPWPGGGQTSASKETFDLGKRLAHWSFQPVRPASPPAVERPDWSRNAIDRFLLAKLQGKGLAPAPPADRRTWLRRVTFDLTGLPPTPAEIAAFLSDRSPAAYERVVDRLLASPAHGERWGRHWLDLMRFAETSGHEFDFEIPHAEGYRDYVIRAFNEDVPHDVLVQEHLAGDLLANPRRHPIDGTNESILGTGAWFLGESKHSPVDLRGDGADRRDNMIDVFGKAFLGMTISCARCHDHKFDPITTREYYSLVSYLQSSRMQRAFLDPPWRIHEPAQRLRALRQQAALLAIARSADVLADKLAGLGKHLLSSRKPTSPARDDLFAVWRHLGDPGVKTQAGFEARKRETIARFEQADKASKQYLPLVDFTLADYRDWFVTGDAFGTAPAGPTDVEIQPARAVPVRRLLRGASSGLTSGRLQGALRSRTFTIRNKYVLHQARGAAVKVNLIIDGFQQIRNPIYGGLTFNVQSATPRWFVQDVSAWRGLNAYVEILDDGDGFVDYQQILFSDLPTPPDPPNRLLVELTRRSSSREELASGYEKLLGETVEAWRKGKTLDGPRLALLDALLQSETIAALPGPDRKLPPEDRLPPLLAEIARREAALPLPRRGLALADGNGIHERVHVRGNPKTLGEEAPRLLPVAVAGTRQVEVTGGSGRLEMAQRLTSADNPLFARVLVNRLWHHHFGSGIVRSPDDFGHQGERPTHPELLDYLAGELVRGGWRLKPMHRLMVLSNAYRMQSRNDDPSDRTDPRNELLHRMPIRRLEAEAIRDSMLAVSGRLDRRMFGRGPLPHLTEFMIGRGRPGSGPLDGEGRRSTYLNVRRNFLNPMFLAFDYPTPFTTMGRRSVSNVPAQALTLLNNPFVTQQARAWAERVTAEPGRSDRDRVKGMYESAFGRPPTSEELSEALAFLAEGGKVDVRAWSDLAHVLFNVKEFIFVN